jgi:hypothetical protein
MKQDVGVTNCSKRGRVRRRGCRDSDVMCEALCPVYIKVMSGPL